MKIYESIYWDKGDRVVYGRVLRDDSIYPNNPGGNSAFYAAIAAGTIPVVRRAGPAWLSARVSYLVNEAFLEVEIASSARVEIKFEQVNSQSLSGSNADGVALSSGIFYGLGDNSDPKYTKQAKFGRAVDGGGGIPALPMVLTFRNVDTSAIYTHIFTPINRASRAVLFLSPGDMDSGSSDYFVTVTTDNLGGPAGSGGGVTSGSGFDTSYTYSRIGSDFAGVAFESSPAPTLTPVIQSKPRLTGNAYSFARQKAQNVFLAERHPAFSLHPSWIVVYAGPGFASQADRAPIITRGYNAIAENVPNRGLITRTRLVPLLPGGYDQAGAVADMLANANPNDPRIAWLRGWKGHDRYHELIDNREAGRAFGQRVYQDYQNQDWANGQPLLGITPNFEIYSPSPQSSTDVESQWRNMDGYFMEGVRLAAIADNKPVPALMMYDWATMCHHSIKLKSRDQDTRGVYDEEGYTVQYDPELGIPFYFSYSAIGDAFKGGSKSAPMAANNVYAQYVKANPAYAGSAEYMRNTWDEETLWQKNSDGTFKTRTEKGVTLLVPRSDARRTVIDGEVTDILPAAFYSKGEGDNFLYLIYERIQQAIVDTYFRSGGKHLSKSTDRQPGWENLKLEQWARHETEFKQGNEVTKPDNTGPSINPATNQPYDVDALNHRPLNADFMERDLIFHLLAGRDMYRFWMEPQPELSSQGAANANTHSRASHEVAQVAMQRVSMMNWIRDNAHQYIIPQYLVRNLGRDRSWYDPNYEFEKNPILLGLLCAARADRNNKPYFAFVASYPAQDVGQYTDGVYWWVDGAGTAITEGYRFRMDGRKTFLDDHEIPSIVANLAPSRFRVQFTDMTGQKWTKTGDYRDATITNHPTPPAISQ